jgi:hypothetical protein
VVVLSRPAVPELGAFREPALCKTATIQDFAMIHEWDIRRRGDAILVGIALDHAILDFETTAQLLRDGLVVLDAPHKGLRSIPIGTFGPFQVTLNKHPEGGVSVFLDGPPFEPNRDMCAAIYLSTQEMRDVIAEALHGAPQ